MMELYILGAGAILILGLFAWAKIQYSRAENLKAQAQASTESAKAAEAEIAQIEKTAAAIIEVKQQLAAKQKTAQAQIDSGKREDFNTEDF